MLTTLAVAGYRSLRDVIVPLAPLTASTRNSPVRRPQVGTRTPTLAYDGASLAATWATIVDAGHGAALNRAFDEAFPESRVEVAASDGLFRLTLRQPGLPRPLDAAQLSDGTLRCLLPYAALVPALHKRDSVPLELVRVLDWRHRHPSSTTVPDYAVLDSTKPRAVPSNRDESLVVTGQERSL